MSKVYEALKRAQEERSSVVPRAAENGNATVSPEASTATLMGPAVVEKPPASTKPVDTETWIQDSADTVVTPVITVKVAAQPSGGAGSPTTGTKEHVAIPLQPEHRLPRPAAGRDPRTGQFLRFEDLLKSCAKPSWIQKRSLLAACASICGWPLTIPLAKPFTTQPANFIKSRNFRRTPSATSFQKFNAAGPPMWTCSFAPEANNAFLIFCCGSALSRNLYLCPNAGQTLASLI